MQQNTHLFWHSTSIASTNVTTASSFAMTNSHTSYPPPKQKIRILCLFRHTLRKKFCLLFTDDFRFSSFHSIPDFLSSSFFFSYCRLVKRLSRFFVPQKNDEKARRTHQQHLPGLSKDAERCVFFENTKASFHLSFWSLMEGKLILFYIHSFHMMKELFTKHTHRQLSSPRQSVRGIPRWSSSVAK